MVQLNLLPDVKLEYIKAYRARRLLTGISIIITGIAVAVLIIMLVVNFALKQHLNSLNSSINQESSTLQGKADISKVLTVQNQLESLTALHAGKPAVSKLFSNYLNEITPVGVFINQLQMDFTQYTATITGTTDSLATVNKYVDTLKFTKYTTDSNSTPTSAFSNVVLTNFGINTAAQDKSQAATYAINLSYSKTIFDITQNVTLNVPNETTTRSALADPGDLFKAAPQPNNSSGGGQ